MSRGLLAWPVDIEPSWPVFMAWSMSSASPPRHSPTMIRSGRMRRALRTSSRIGIAPLPSMFGGRDSSVTTCSWRSWSSAASSIVTIRSSFGMNDDSTLRVVVLPEPVPPETKMFRRASTQALQEVEHLRAWPCRSGSRSSTVNGEAENFRIVMTGPTSDSGGMIALTREPSVRRASTIGRDSSTRRPIGAMIRSMIRITWSSFWKTTLVSSSLPRALDVDLARAVDHDFGDGLVAQERLERAEADDLVGDLLEHPDALGAGQGQALLVDDPAEDLLDLAPDLDLVGQVELGVQVLDDPALDPELDVPEGLPDRAPGDISRWPAAPARCRRRRRAPPAGAGALPGAPGAAPGRALSIRFSRDIAYTPSGPTSGTMAAQRHANSDLRLAAALRRRPRLRACGRRRRWTVASRRMSWDTWASRLLQDERYATVEA